CDLCDTPKSAYWRCDSCQCNRDLCTPCIRKTHMPTPYHRVRYYEEHQYREAWLRDAGVFIQLCPRGSSGPFSMDDPDDDVWPDEMRGGEMDEGEAEARLRDNGEGEELGEGIARKRGKEAKIDKDPWGYDVMVIVHEVDIHQIGVAYCKCQAGAGLLPYDEQLLRYGGLMPVTTKNPETCFTLRGLAYHQMDRLVGKITPWAKMRKLRRHTNPLHPSTVADRYAESLRIMREYPAIDNLIVHGFAHQPEDKWKPPPPGKLMHGCITCPVAENLPKGYAKDKDSWAFFYSLAHDGNFSAQHTVSRQPGNNVPLFPGTGAFQDPVSMKEDLASMKSDQDVKKPCHKHQAAALTGKTRNKITDIKGIGAWACARHGCFCRGGTCNYLLGEASNPADVALNNVFKINTDAELIDRIQLLYDIWCRYGAHLRERFDGSPNVSWPKFREVMGGVGVWHIYGHIFQCYGRWSNLYARHCGIVDGEILETLWSVLNQILESCRGMSLANREEVITMFQSDSNLRKTLNMGARFTSSPSR
ncbi:hypothetical protein PENSPDRAFT_591598, partial [Peniophora sp. CONT]